MKQQKQMYLYFNETFLSGEATSWPDWKRLIGAVEHYGEKTEQNVSMHVDNGPPCSSDVLLSS